MTISKFTTLSIAAVSALFFLVSFTSTTNAQTLYSCVTPEDGNQPFLRIIDPDTGNTVSSFDLSLPGFELRGCRFRKRSHNWDLLYDFIHS
jgi:hypothetical protein